MTGDDREEEDNEEELSFMVWTDRFKWDTSHEAFEVDRFLEHHSEIVLQGLLDCVFDHFKSSLSVFRNCTSL